MGAETRRASAPVPGGRVDLGGLNAAWNLGGAEYLALRLSIVSKLIDRYVSREAMALCGLSLPEWRVVAQLALTVDASVAELARHAWVDRSEVSRAVRGLEHRDLVQRRENPADRRSPRFSLTPEGRGRFEKFRPQWRALQSRLLADLSGEETVTVNAALGDFARTLLDLLGE